MKKFLSPLVISLLAVFFVTGVVFAQWQEPTQSPPEGNVPSPLHVGSEGQSKEGGLILNTGGAGTGLIIQEGRVGIGTTNPASHLHVASGNNSYALFGPNSNWNGYLYVGARPNIITTNRAQVISTNGNLHLDSAPNRLTYVNHYSRTHTIMNVRGGNVGIGTQNPRVQLHVTDGGNRSGAGGAIGFSANNNHSPMAQIKGALNYAARGDERGDLVFSTRPNVGQPLIERMRVSLSGNVGIGTTGWIDTSNYRLNVNGNVIANAYFHHSDARLKENIEEVNGITEGLREVRTVRFTREGSEDVEIGILAQELEEHFPEAVREDAEGMKAVHQGALTALLLGAIKEQGEEIRILKEEVAALKEEMVE